MSGATVLGSSSARSYLVITVALQSSVIPMATCSNAKDMETAQNVELIKSHYDHDAIDMAQYILRE